jgi:hypothetical protein
VKETDTFSALTLTLSQREREPIMMLGGINEKPTVL